MPATVSNPPASTSRPRGHAPPANRIKPRTVSSALVRINLRIRLFRVGRVSQGPTALSEELHTARFRRCRSPSHSNLLHPAQCSVFLNSTLVHSDGVRFGTADHPVLRRSFRPIRRPAPWPARPGFTVAANDRRGRSNAARPGPRSGRGNRIGPARRPAAWCGGPGQVPCRAWLGPTNQCRPRVHPVRAHPLPGAMSRRHPGILSDASHTDWGVLDSHTDWGVLALAHGTGVRRAAGPG